ncbi:MAG: ABC transporter ATP-binding protein [bacterium]
MILETKNISKSFGGVKALSNLDFSIEKGEIVSVIGPNGSGKTTFFNLITGFYKPDKGEILFKQKRIDSLAPHQITHLGISRTFQNIRLFPNMTALENVMIGRHTRTKGELFEAIFRLPSFKKEEEEITNSSKETLDFVSLLGVGNYLARNLPYGDQRRIEIARALSSEPDLLLLDEPTAGMNKKENKEIISLVRKIRDRGKTIILIEHQMDVVMEVSDRIVVLDYGEKIASGKPDEIKNDPCVIKAYLGDA